jgi:predicted methyltransferase
VFAAFPAAKEMMTMRFRPLTLILIMFSALVGADDVSTGTFADRIAVVPRYADDLQADTQRMPVEVIGFSRIATGMTVADVGSIRGYFAEVLAVAVGNSGSVYAQNDGFVRSLDKGRVGEAFDSRFAGDRVPNVIRWDREFDALDFLPDSLDAATIMFVYHDLVLFYPRETRIYVLQQLRVAIKPGGYLVVGDHQGIDRETARELHRISSDTVLDEVLLAGFELIDSSDLLRNEDDDLSASIFEPSLRGKTDRFLFLFRSPG